MTLDLAATVPLAIFAGALSILSPCVWPLVPIVMGSAATAGRGGQLALALGLSIAFALAGTLLTFLLLSAGLDPELLRFIAAFILVLVALPLVHAGLGSWVTRSLGALVSWIPHSGGGHEAGWRGQFGVGLLLGIVWLPCVGPTLGAAIALAAVGQQMLAAFGVMFAFGVGTASVLLAAGHLSSKLLMVWRPRLLSGAGRGKRLLGYTLLLLGLMVLTGVDKQLEAVAVSWLPDWSSAL